jgi:hypothetical protein
MKSRSLSFKVQGTIVFVFLYCIKKARDRIQSVDGDFVHGRKQTRGADVTMKTSSIHCYTNT